MTRRTVLALLALLALGLAACSPDPVDDPTPDEPDADPDPVEEDEREADEDTATGPEVTVFFVRASDRGDRLWVEPEVHRLDEPTEGVGQAAVQLALGGEPHDPDLMRITSGAAAGATVVGGDVAERVLTVDVSGELADEPQGAAAEQALAQQLAHTAAAFDGIDRVALQLDGEPVEQLWGHVDWSEPIAADRSELSPVHVEHPTYDQHVTEGSLEVRGGASTFERNVIWRLIDPDGQEVDSGFTTHGQWDADAPMTLDDGQPNPDHWGGPFTFDVELDAPGEWVVEVTHEDPADPPEGFGAVVVTRPVTVVEEA